MFPNQITMEDVYLPVATYYDLLSKWYSFGRVSRCRSAFSAEVGRAVVDAGDRGVRVCYVGAGHGEEALEVAKCGAMVTVVDVSASMLEVFQRRLDGYGDEVRERVRVVHDDVRNVEDRYDWVVGNFFLNIFSEDEMVGMLERLRGLCKDGGSLVIGDFCYDAEGGMLVRFMQRLNWYVALRVFRMFVKNAEHSIYCYEDYLSEWGWEMEERKVFGILGVSLYQSARFVEMEEQED